MQPIVYLKMGSNLNQLCVHQSNLEASSPHSEWNFLGTRGVLQNLPCMSSFCTFSWLSSSGSNIRGYHQSINVPIASKWLPQPASHLATWSLLLIMIIKDDVVILLSHCVHIDSDEESCCSRGQWGGTNLSTRVAVHVPHSSCLDQVWVNFVRLFGLFGGSSPSLVFLLLSQFDMLAGIL